MLKEAGREGEKCSRKRESQIILAVNQNRKEPEVSGKASVVVIQETLLAGNLPEESLPEGIHVLGSSGSME